MGYGMNWNPFRQERCKVCDAKDERIAGLLVDLESLKDVRSTMSKLEELAKLEERKDALLDAIDTLKLKEQAKRKEQRELPPTWMQGRQEGRLPPL